MNDPSTVAPDLPVILLTGFGPFRHYNDNPSWKAVKLLSEEVDESGICDLERELGVRLVTVKIPVEYRYVKEELPKLWKKHKPKLVIHCGVSSQATVLTLEQCARNCGYYKVDVSGNLPEKGVCLYGCSNYLESTINMEDICKTINICKNKTLSCVSHDAGMYLCEFIYFTSLSIDCSCSSFIHVPEEDDHYSIEEITEGIRQIIIEMWRYMKQRRKITNSIA